MLKKFERKSFEIVDISDLVYSAEVQQKKRITRIGTTVLTAFKIRLK